ncbi:MCE family protein [Rhodopseudomonas boonkerdii]|uniref:MlaD family protein n=1 Tax=Rhodopseudomonas boonkerdii TaxID=475937 RepID=UPI001E37CAA8|nr:MlaD family protein [Rhodopseudomonas boonkerdii]UGV27515.1 MCE family protein [Rhodopseudomonas boonkerdii]
METRANYVLIGTFTLAVIAAVIGFVMWSQNLNSGKQRTPLRIVFEGSASGLRNGGNVNFNGIRVGEVVSVKLDNPRRVVALAMIDTVAPIRKDTLAGLEFQGLTGVAAISLKGGAPDAPDVPIDTDGVPVLTADPDATRDIGEAVRATLQNVNRLVNDNQEALKGAISNVEAFTGVLARNAESIDGIMKKIDSIMGKADGVVAKTDNIMLGLDTLAGGKDGGALTAAVKSFHELTENLDKRSGQLIIDGRRTLGDASRTLGDISRAVNNLDRNPTRLLFGPSSSTQQAPPPQQQPPLQQRRR